MSTILDRSHRMYDPTSPITSSPATNSGSSHQNSNNSNSQPSTNESKNVINSGNNNSNGTMNTNTMTTTNNSNGNNNNNNTIVWNDPSSIECNNSHTENSATTAFEETNTNNKRLLSTKLNGKSTLSNTKNNNNNSNNNNMVCHHFSSHTRPSPPQQQSSQQSLSSMSNHVSTKDRSMHTSFTTTTTAPNCNSSSNSTSSSSSNTSVSSSNSSIRQDLNHLPRQQQRQGNKSKSLRKRRLEEAKYDYESRIEQYFQQLTVGCGRYDCTNRFCATGKGGISNLHRQAALVMSIQLASKPESRLCQHHHASYETTTTNKHIWNTSIEEDGEEEEDDFYHEEVEDQKYHHHYQQQEKQEDQYPTRAKPFLQSLFSSSSFLSLFGMQVEHDKQSTHNDSNKLSKNSRRRRRSKRENYDLPNRTNHQMNGNRALMGSSCNTSTTTTIATMTQRSKSEQQSSFSNSNIDSSNCNNDIDDSFYYQLDSMSDDSASSHSSSYESDTSSEEGMLLAIRPNIIAHLNSGIDQIQQLSNQQKINHWCRGIFQNWEGIGNSLLFNDDTDLISIVYRNDEDVDNVTSFHKINFGDLHQFYKALLGTNNNNNNNIRISETVTESLETLLDRMNMNADGMTSLVTIQDTDSIHSIVEWCRSLLAVMEWIRIQQQKSTDINGSNRKDNESINNDDAHANTGIPGAKTMASSSIAISGDMWSGILSHKFIQVVNKIACHRQSVIRQVLKQYLASLDVLRMRSLVTHLHDYLINHFHTGPYKHGEQDSVVMATKFLELAYEANLLPTTDTIIPASDFNCEAVCKKLNIKNEYRIWRRVLQYGEGRHSISTIAASRQSSSASQFYGLNEQQRRTRLFLTTTSTSILLPYPFANEYQFSWFSYPFLLPPPVKRKILQLDAMSQMSAEYEDACVNHTLVVHARRLLSDAPRMVRNLETNLKSATCPYLLLEIRREHFVEDTFHQVSRQWVNIKKPLKIKFVGGGEEGMDQGGVQKEFFNVLFEKLMAPSMGLFDTDPETRLQWMLPVVHSEESLRTYEMVGVMMGLAIYNGVIMNLQFPQILWKILVLPNESNIETLASSHKLFTFQDLCEGWPALSHGLQQLLDWEDDDVQDVFCRNYEISLDVFGQGVVTWPLKPGGSNIPVTNTNRLDFVRDYCTHFLYYAQREPLLAIRRGLWSIMGGSAMNLCTAQVLEVVACGQRQSVDLDLEELERATEYDDGYNAEHITVRNFWSVVHQDMTPEQKRKLLFFVTASDRVPVGGLMELTFVVQRNGPDSDRLPTALTCFSRLLLPEYASREKLSERLITAIENAKGFGLV
ncbi:hypothetical protein INT45_004354 [Circinella minor]|uniref:HECT-type E3 ubiquitin transferase n=1 Tax=Circinella minor TaxID=1195481 RepID=A0A8H7S864_9FUNG|nr:hypothetical protein INT45_004354 [Circinella minor]